MHESRRRETVKHDRESRGTRNQKSLCCRGPPAIYPTELVNHEPVVDSRELRILELFAAVSCEIVASRQRPKHKSGRISIVGNRNRATSSEGYNRQR
jgi:hypothetical protein